MPQQQAEMVEQHGLEDNADRLHVMTDTSTARSVAADGVTIPVRAIFDETERLAAVR
jgi:hypothetical protein